MSEVVAVAGLEALAAAASVFEFAWTKFPAALRTVP